MPIIKYQRATSRGIFEQGESRVLLSEMYIMPDLDLALKEIYRQFQASSKSKLTDEKRKALLHYLLRLGVEKFNENLGGVQVQGWDIHVNKVSRPKRTTEIFR
jgi:hypothetical protein